MIGWLCLVSSWVISSPWLILDFGWDSFWKLVEFSVILAFAVMSFGLSVVMSKEKIIDWGVILVGTVIPVSIFGMFNGLILGIGVGVGELIGYLMIRQSLRSYLTFSTNNLIMPAIKTVAMVVIIGFSIIYGIGLQKNVEINGFKLPDGIIDSAIKMSGGDQLMDSQNSTGAMIDQISKDSGLLSSLGISQEQLKSSDPNTLEKLLGSNQKTSSQSLIRDTVNKQLANTVAPFLAFVGLIAGGLFLLSMLGVISLLYPLIAGFIWVIFKLLESANLIQFEKEMREVRKLVV